MLCPIVAATQQRILITQATPGMVLAEHVLLPGKVVLCARDAELSDALIARMMQRGIKRIHVRGTPLPVPEREPWSAVTARLHHRFSRVAHVPFMAELARAAERVMARRVR